MADETVTETENTAVSEGQATTPATEASAAKPSPASVPKPHAPSPAAFAHTNPACPIYTSDAADDKARVALGGGRIDQKKKTNKKMADANVE
ncbi:hypothetical protein [Bifidobacterium olomucense]|uniref:hypothetical protein n=1 Tax=Bifidobacterium olomucense TaxID=2675324 RepID=UPI00145C84AC|nr:hypothetical protein [Bifidobacterium sp. DSM 109959]